MRAGKFWSRIGQSWERLSSHDHRTVQSIKGNEIGPFLTNTPETCQPNWMRTQQYYLDPRVFAPGTCDEQMTIINTYAAGNRYHEALLAIIQMDLPIYHHPKTIIQEPPRQKKSKSLSAYFYQYIHYLKLQAYLKDINKNLDLPDKLDNFIDGTIHAAEFQKLIRKDQKAKRTHCYSTILSKLNCWNPEQIEETFHQWYWET